jgi:hypothetical protein
MIARLLPPALAVLALPVFANPDCENTGGPDSCSRVLACIGEDGVWFDGRSVGWNSGTLAGELNDGTICTGSWAYTGPNVAEAHATCDHGLEIAVVAVAQDPPTGTTIAEGFTSDGRRVVAWTGNNVLEFLRGPRREPRLPCTGDPVPIS